MYRYRRSKQTPPYRPSKVPRRFCLCSGKYAYYLRMSSDDDFELTFSSQDRLTKSEATARKLALMKELTARGLDPKLANHADLSRSIKLKDLKMKVEKEKQSADQKQTNVGTKTREQAIAQGKLEAGSKQTTDRVLEQSQRQQATEKQGMQDEIQTDAS
jgi:hypothetical protein